MPTVTREDGFEIIVYSGNEHRPPHVHVFKNGATIRVAIGDELTYPHVIGKGNTIAGRELVKAVRLVKKHQATCSNIWRRIHG
jgi:hypothetical protein